MKKCVIVYNKHSGKKNKRDFIEDFIEVLKVNGYQPEVIYSKYKAHIIEIVRDLPDDINLVISIGGDGTFNESMRGNFERQKRLTLAHIPLGTTNDVGKMFGYRKDPIDNLKLLMAGVKRKMDICTINGVPFIYVAGFGKYMNIPYETSRKTKKRFGYLAYVGNGFKSFLKRTKMHDITYEVNGETYSGEYSFLAITNATRIAGMKIFDNIKLDDNQFEVLFCNIKKRKDVIKSIVRLRKTTIDHVPGFYFHEADSLKIIVHNEKGLPWCLDGEKYEIEDNTIEIKIDRNTEIMLPRKNIKELFKKK
jgi:diacylglycerol kinase (ATP)